MVVKFLHSCSTVEQHPSKPTSGISFLGKGLVDIIKFKNNPNINSLKVGIYNVIFFVCFSFIYDIYKNPEDHFLVSISCLLSNLIYNIPKLIYNYFRKKNNSTCCLAQGIFYNFTFMLSLFLFSYIFFENNKINVITKNNIQVFLGLAFCLAFLCSKFIYDVIYYAYNKLKTLICKKKNNALKEQEVKITKTEPQNKQEEQINQELAKNQSNNYQEQQMSKNLKSNSKPSHQEIKIIKSKRYEKNKKLKSQNQKDTN